MSIQEKIKPRLHTFEICDRVEEKNGKQSFFGLFKNINTVGLPAVHANLSIVLGFSRGKGTFTGKFVIENVSKHEIHSHEFEIEFPDVYIDHYQITNVTNLHLMEVGVHSVKVFLDDEIISDREFVVTIQRPRELTDDERRKLLEDPDVIKSAKLSIGCPKCETQYEFQVNLDPDKPLDEGVLPWPPGNKFRCPKDGMEIDLTGIRLTILSKIGTPKPDTPEV